MGVVSRRLISIASGLAALLAASATAQADPAIGDFSDFQQVSAQRVSRVVTEYTYRAFATNDTPAVENVTATVTSSSPNTVIIEGDLAFGSIAANGSTLSSDTFTFRHDRRFPFDPSALDYSFQFDPVPSNTPPVADAGLDQTVLLGAVVTLDGSGSSDADGDPLTFSWSLIAVPVGSSATLDDPSAVAPRFVPDVPGSYTAQLIVNDGTVDSLADTVVVSTQVLAPTADAGPNQNVAVGATVTLDGSGSSDPAGLPLSYAWSLISVPPGSSALLADPSAISTTFVADLPGTYEAQLIVNNGLLDSAPDTVTITTSNTAPVADAGPDQTVLIADTVTLDGSGSNDIDGDPLTFSWSLISVPAGSTATLNDTTAVNPTFVIDLPGSYVAQLVVNDGTVNSLPDTVTVSTSNSPPVADAGPDQVVLVNDTVTLDGSGSSDVDGDPLTFSWTLTSIPAGSAATLSNPNAVNPTFVADVSGSYTAQLVVNDGTVDSTPDTVTITTGNTPPVAEAGPDQTAFVGDTVTLDGGASSDVDGDPLTFSWSFVSVPAGSAAALNDTTAVMPTFLVDLSGTYVVQLIVNDGTEDSTPDTVTITTDNTPPVADAGPDQTVLFGDTVTLDGSGSSDVDGDPLTFSWSLITVPAGSSAALSDTTAIMPTFSVDVSGTYVAQLIVNDGFVDSAPDTVTITTDNTPPVADAGPDQSVLVNATVTLDGNGSSDVDLDPLTFSWSLTAVPAGSAATLTNPTSANPSFVADQRGDYVAQLIVNDGTVDSAPDTVMVSTINSTPVADAGPDQIASVGDTVTLDGSGSSDADGDPLTFFWSLISVPAGSGATLSSSAAVSPTFVADLPGDYLAQLIVNDGTVDSAPDTSLVVVTVGPATTITLSPNPIQTLTRELLTLTATLDNPAATGGQTFGISLSNSLATAPLDVTVPEGATSATFGVLAGTAAGSVNVSVSGGGLSDTATIDISLRDFTLVSPLVGIDRTVVGILTLNEPAPAGGASFDLSTDDPTSVSVAPSVLTIPAGQTVGTFELTGGLTVSTAILTADGSSNGYTVRTLALNVTDQLIDTPTFEQLALGEARTIQVLIAPDPAPPGGLSISLSSDDTSLVQVLTPVVFIPEGSFTTTADIQAGTGAAGTATITASNAGFAPDRTTVLVSTGLDIVESIAFFDPGETEDIFVELTSGGRPFTAPAGGVSINFSSDDTACVTVASPNSVPAGQSFGGTTLSYGGSAALPCVATVTADNALFGSDTVQVTVGQVPDLGALALTDTFSLGVGGGLQRNGTITLPTGAHGGVTIQFSSSDPSTALVAPRDFLRGLPVGELFVPDGQTSVTYSLKGVQQAAGTVTITASSPRFTDGTLSVDIVQPVFDLSGLVTTASSLAANDPFNVFTYVPNAAGTSLGQFQQIATGQDPLSVTLTSSDPAVGLLVGQGGTPAASVTVDLLTGASQTNVPVPQFDPIAGGTTTVTASAPGFVSIPAVDSQVVTVTAAALTVNTGSTLGVGAGLQRNASVNLGASDHGGVTIRVESSDAALALVAPNANATTAGSAFIDVFVPDGSSSFGFTIQGVTGATGTATITATNALFATGTGTVDIRLPVLDISGLVASTTTLSANDSFNVFTYVPNAAGTNLGQFQALSAAAGPLTVTITSSDPAVGQILGQSGSSAASDTTVLQLGNSQINVPVPQFDPTGGGTTTVTASAAGFASLPATDSQDVTVTGPVIIVNTGSTLGVGGGLQRNASLNLGASNHGGITVRIESSNAALALVAAGANASTAGAAFVDVPVANGVQSVNFTIQGVSGATGTATITASSAGFGTGNATVDIRQPVLDLSGLVASTTSLSANDSFNVFTYVPNAAGTNLGQFQALSAAAGPLTVTITSSDPAVGQILGQSGTPSASDTVELQIGNGQINVPVPQFDPSAAGTTTVTASAAGFGSLPATDTQVVTVSAPTITVSTGSTLGIGAGLQRTASLNLGAGNHGGVTVRIESSDAALALVAPGAASATAGAAFIDVAVPNGTSALNFTIQGVVGATGTATITASAPGFGTGSGTVDIRLPILDLSGLVTATTTLSTNDSFNVFTYVPNAAGTNLGQFQIISAAAGPLTVTLTSSDPTVGQILGQSGSPSASDSVVLQLGGGQTNVPVPQFDPIATGTTTVTASAANFASLPATDSQVVTVNPSGISVFAPATVGAGLQQVGSATLDTGQHGGVTVRIASSNPAVLLVAPDATTAGTSFFDIVVPNGQATVNYVVQGVSGATGSSNVIASSPLFVDGSDPVNVVTPILDLSGLVTSIAAGGANDSFNVFTYIPNGTGTGLGQFQTLSAAAGPLTVTITSSDPAVGLLVGQAGTPAASATVELQLGSSQTNVPVAQFDPQASGTTTVTASATNFASLPATDSQVVNVTP